MTFTEQSATRLGELGRGAGAPRTRWAPARKLLTGTLVGALATASLIAISVVAVPSSASAAPGDPAQLYVGPSYEVGTIGSDKDFTAPTECASNSVLTGVRVENRQDVAPNGPNSILTQFAIQCSTITTGANGAVVTTVNPTWQSGPVYDQGRGNLQTAVCPAGTVGTRMSGTTFVGMGTRWPSQVQITCQPLVLQPTGEMRINLAGPTTVLTAGTNFNTNGGLQTPTPLCGPGGTTGTSNIILRGYRAQSGGEGIDGYNPSCAVIPRDFGDAPASYGSASHELNAATYLGSAADTETAQQTSADASGDNVVGGTAPNRSINDEDGVSTFGTLTAGVTSTYSVQVAASNKMPLTAANLVGWIDFNRNGTFEANEGASVVVPAGTADGSVSTLTWNGVDAQTVAGNTFARFRIGTASTTTATPTGNGSVGEVEDYPVTIQAASPALTLTKTATPTTATDAGTPVTYSFAVTNTGDIRLSNVTINETAFSGTGTLGTVTCRSTNLAAGASTTCSASYTATQADVDAGVLTNTATATGTVPTGGTTTSTPSTATVTFTPAPALTVTKSASPNTPESYTVGQQVTYSFLVRNTGNTTLTDVTVDEGTFTGSGQMSAVNCPADETASLAPRATVTCTATYTLTQSDVDAGSVTNTATANGTPPNGDPVPSPPSETTVPVTPNPSLSVVKSASPESATNAGDDVTYSFVLTNTGNVTLTDVTVDEGTFTGTGDLSAVDCPAGAASLLPGASVTCTATYELTQADVDAGSVTNTATGTGTPPGGGTVDTPPSTAIVTVDPTPSLTVVKTATPDTVGEAGEQVTYSFRVTNTGNVTLTDVAIDEGAFSGTGDISAISCPAAAASLAPGAVTTCTATYTLTQADVDAGSVTNTATATGTPPDGDTVDSPPSETTVTVPPAPGLRVVKTSDTDTITRAGQTLTYSFRVTNTGNVTISGVSVSDQDFSGTGTLSAISCPTTTLAPGARITCTATYTVTQADVDAGQITNAATVDGNTPDGESPPATPPSTVTVPVAQTAAITVVKSASISGDDYTVGSAVTYSFVATNSGNTTLENVSIEETAFSGTGELSAISCPADETASLVPGDQVTCTATYTLTQADIDAGQVTNTAVAHGTPPSTVPNGELTSQPSDAVVPTPQAASLTVVKSADVQQITKAGQKVTFTFRVTNTGNVTITDPTVTDSEFSGTGKLSAISCPASGDTLLPGQAVDCSATYTVTQADVDSGALRNTATAGGNTPGGPPTDPSPPSTVTIPSDPTPGITVVKTADSDSVVGAGQRITYTFTVTNTGDVTLRDVQIDDRDFTGTGKLSAISCPAGIGAVAPGQVVACTATYVTTAADVRAGAVSNTAVATGVPTTGREVPPSAPSTVKVPIHKGATTLAFTGANVALPIGIAAALLLGGAILFTIQRRRRNQA